jgi:hypothetical protein
VDHVSAPEAARRPADLAVASFMISAFWTAPYLLRLAV